MTGADFAVIAVWLVFLAVGARKGSVWTGACILGGFLSASLVDYYTYPLAEMLGGFNGAPLASGLLLFAFGLIVVLLPAYLLSQISSSAFVPLLDGLLGILTGAFAGAFLISMLLLLVIPVIPKLEKKPAYRNSLIVRPFHAALEELFSLPPRQMKFMKQNIQQGTAMAGRAKNQLKGLTQKLDPTK